MYGLIRKFFFRLPAEDAHYYAMNAMRMLCATAVTRKLISSLFEPGKAMSVQALNGLPFKNPVGLGAGFDKNAKYLRELDALGFGFVEIGTVTPLPQAGNEKPRLFRLPMDKALVNRMGFNNDGVKTIAGRLRKWKERTGQEKDHRPRMIVGGNIGKNKMTPNEDAWKDYEICFKELHPYVDYFVVNVSSPNTPGLRELQEKESLRKILMHLKMINNGKAVSKPILLKIAPDLTKEQIDDVIDLAMEIKLDGIVAANTTISRNHLLTPGDELQKIGAGGLSGQPLKERSTEIVKYISGKTDGQVALIASGGVFSAADASEKMDAGASLVQVWTGFIYEGPGIVKKICRNLNLSNG
jgi:dihydroorotate dehydrogenase